MIGGAGHAAMALEAVDGSAIAHVAFRNVTYTNVGTPLFLLVGDRGVRPNPAPRMIGGIDDVTFQNVTGSSDRYSWGAIVSGLAENGQTHGVSNVHFDNVNLTMRGGSGNVPALPPEYDSAFSNGHYPDPDLWGNVPAAGIFFRHASNVTFTNSTIKLASGDARPLFSGDDVTNVAGPTCTVHFVLHTSPDAPRLGGGTTLAIAGATTGTGLPLASDPLGNWERNGAGVVLAASASDPTTYTADVALPQGAALAYKAITSANGNIAYERSGAGNRTASVPSATSATIELAWEN